MTLSQCSRLWLSAIFVLAASLAVANEVDPDPAKLKHGEFIWHPEIAPSGPLVLLVSLDEQRAYVYRNGIAVGVTTISSGRFGHRTKPGLFTILQKKVIAYSNLYDNAPMPYMERLTWDGIALHGGVLPGYPASHGCIRLPQRFAKKLFEVTKLGVVVVVADSKSAPESMVHPAMLVPLASDGSARAPLPDGTTFWSDPPEVVGPVSILVTLHNRSVFVFRNGELIASTTFAADEPPFIGGSILYVMSEGMDYSPSPLDPSRPKHLWTAYPIATRSNPAPRTDVPASFRLPADFARRMYDVLVPGTTILVTDMPATRKPASK